jgi:hypothetical protein
MYCAGIFKQSMGPRNRVGKGLSYRPARLHRLTEMIPWNRFLGFLKGLQILALAGRYDKPFPCQETPPGL